MPFALGVAIADLFARIAAALRSSGPQAIGPLPPSGGPSPTPPPPPSPTPPPGGIIPEPPHQGTPMPPLPPPVVSVPGDNLFPGTPVDPADCPPISLADQIALWGLQLRQERPSQTQEPGGIIITPSEDDMGATYNAVTILEATDYFRFRAISTSDNVAVSFFGRIRSSGGQIVPFNRTIDTAVANTLYEVTVPTGPGVLLGAAASVPVGSITSGTVNAIGEIGRVSGSTFLPHTLLFSGQLDDQQALSTTNATPTIPVAAPTFIAAAMSAAVAVTSTTTITPSANRSIRICHISADYNCSAVAGNRQLVVRLRNTSMTLHEALPNEYVTASQTGVCRASLGYTSNSPSGALPGAFRQCAIHLPTNLYFRSATEVIFSAYGIQAGDTITPGFIRYEET